MSATINTMNLNGFSSLSMLDLIAFQIGLREPETCRRPSPSWIARAFRSVFGIPVRTGLANPRLEQLRQWGSCIARYGLDANDWSTTILEQLGENATHPEVLMRML